MKSIAQVFFILALSPGPAAVQAAGPNQLTAAEIEAGWVQLFDGETLFGWQAATEVNWRVDSGAITADAGVMGLLVTELEFADYLLSLEFRADPDANSGIFLRTQPVCQSPGPGGQCYELNIAPSSNPYPTGSLVQRLRAGSAGESADWRRVDVLARGPRIEVWIDGSRVLGYTDPEPLLRGRIGLQFNQGKVAFRDLKLKPLGLDSLLQGPDLTGWTPFPGKSSEFLRTVDGGLRVLNGPGQLETIGSWSDFVLQLEVRVNGDRLNSGIFFRSIRGEFWQGYESQIHNGSVDGDPARPEDFGTGGIYRRQPARRIVARDREWFSKTVVATGATFGVWVNGYPVTCWRDERPAHDNPRQGLRLAAGTVSIQGHDPTTDLEFRRIRIAHLPER